MDTYEKKYKEALKLARVAAFNGHQSLMEGIFPELAESEDEKTRKRIIALVNAHGQGMYKDDMLAWLEKIEKQGEQKPQRMISAEAKEAIYGKPAYAWSEEDEKKMSLLIKILEVNPPNAYFEVNPVSTLNMEAMYVGELVDWLKSLKERYTWKPSDAQMKALKEACDKSWEPDGFDPLYTLYEQLKKLKGE